MLNYWEFLQIVSQLGETYCGSASLLENLKEDVAQQRRRIADETRAITDQVAQMLKQMVKEQQTNMALLEKTAAQKRLIDKEFSIITANDKEL